MGARVLFLVGLALLLVACESTPVPAVGSATPTPSTNATVTPPPAIPTSRSTDLPTPSPANTPMLTCPIAQVAEPWGELDPQTFSPVGNLAEEQSFGDYVVRIYERYSTERVQDPCGDVRELEVLQRGQRIYAVRGYARFWIGRYWQEGTDQHLMMPMGQDITADGIPDLVITTWTGGAHCCTTYYVFELGDTFHLLGLIDAGDYDSTLKDLDQDGNWEFLLHDWVIEPCLFWACCCGPDPYVIVHYRDGGYHLVPGLMRKPAPTAGEMDQLALKFAGPTVRRPLEGNAEFWDVVMDLIYSGHVELVDPFLERVWPQDKARRDDFRTNILRTISHSLYWSEIRALSAEWPWPDMTFALPDPHHHVVDLTSGTVPVSIRVDFRFAQVTLDPNVERYDVVTSSDGAYQAFRVEEPSAGGGFMDRLIVEDLSSGKTYEIQGLPAPWRPFSDLVWIDPDILVFDRWSQPHYGWHYAVDVRQGQLIQAAPFPDQWMLSGTPAVLPTATPPPTVGPLPW